MNTLKIIFTCFLLVIITGCATEKGLDAYKHMSAAQILALGEQNISKGNYSDSVKNFEAMDALYPFEKEAEQAQLDVIYAYYKAGDPASALAAADRYIHMHPRDVHTDYAYFMKGIVNFDRNRSWLQKLYAKNADELDLSNLREAFIDFNDLIKLFPDSKYAYDARLRMIYIRHLLALRELTVAQFYYDRGAYVAAANRASYVVKHFQGATEVRDALVIMVKSYRAVGADKQANDALRVLNVSYPGTKI
ncbi:MAG: outer membrane protein assembly factor BamD [Gammaproteobacteria bacterium]|nr:outer membrane protein assembly factor BamD [Gammaproteobacteria bacterium]